MEHKVIALSDILSQLNTQLALCSHENIFNQMVQVLKDKSLCLFELRADSTLTLPISYKQLDFSKFSPEVFTAIKGMLYSMWHYIDSEREEKLTFDQVSKHKLVLKTHLTEFAKQEIKNNSQLSDQDLLNFINWREYAQTLPNPYVYCDEYYLLKA